MTLLLYDYYDLQERASRHLNVWKAWHLILYALAAIFGILNYVFLHNTMQLVDNNCVLFPRELAFRSIELPAPANISSIEDTVLANSTTTENPVKDDDDDAQNIPALVASETTNGEEKNATITKRDVTNSNNTRQNDTDTSSNENDVIVLSANETHRLVLDTSRTLFGWDSDCQYAEYMPIMSMILAAAWATFFVMCPGGGYSRSGLQQPWRILTPALLFALVMVGLTGHSFTTTNRGLFAFCSAFYNTTNATTCSSVGPFLERSWNASWSFGGRAAAARAASAGVWASWACAAALFLARCLTAPDFSVTRTGAYLKDPQQRLTPYLKKSSRRHAPNKSNNNSPTKRETASIRSEPTMTTELVTASVEHGQDTAPTTPQFSPIKRFEKEDIEMTTTPY
ncbi:uncharacterized protein LOC123875043 [Maniola jurtina]|uniref:uncharacterized protein LOC123875043 n=1 Tax=Maniola jurtina TaxID=191418 RepID=UPI001E68FCE2|nr:uncharacterized protein LOC123875043 [Maniola jurtina]XP_045776651.1 uncharacterized protein LOC123875043 [Maniola jurtina]